MARSSRQASNRTCGGMVPNRQTLVDGRGKGVCCVPRAIAFKPQTTTVPQTVPWSQPSIHPVGVAATAAKRHSPGDKGMPRPDNSGFPSLFFSPVQMAAGGNGECTPGYSYHRHTGQALVEAHRVVLCHLNACALRLHTVFSRVVAQIVVTQSVCFLVGIGGLDL